MSVLGARVSPHFSLAACALGHCVASFLGPGRALKAVTGEIVDSAVTLLKALDSRHPHLLLIHAAVQAQYSRYGTHTASLVVFTALLSQSIEALVDAHGHGQLSAVCELFAASVDDWEHAVTVSPELCRDTARVPLSSLCASLQHADQWAADEDNAVVARAVTLTCEQLDAHHECVDDWDLRSIAIRPDARPRATEPSAVRVHAGVMIAMFGPTRSRAHKLARDLPRVVRVALISDELEQPRAEHVTEATAAAIVANEYRRHHSVQRLAQRLQDLAVDVVLCLATIDSDVETACAARGIVAVPCVPPHSFQLLSRLTAGTAVPTVDALNEDFCGRACAQTITSSASATEARVELLFTAEPNTASSRAASLTVCVTCSSDMAAARFESRFWRLLNRVRNAKRDGRMLAGGGSVELAAAAALETTSEQWTAEKRALLSAVRESLVAVLREYVSLARANRGLAFSPCESMPPTVMCWDDCAAKFASVRAALRLCRATMTSDGRVDQSCGRTRLALQRQPAHSLLL